MGKGAGLNIAWHEFAAKPHTIAGEEEMRVIREFVKAGAAADRTMVLILALAAREF